MMSPLVFIILVNLSISTNILFGENICSHFDDEDCVHPNVIKNGHFVNQWSVNLPGLTKGQARKLLEDNGFDYLGKVTIVHSILIKFKYIIFSCLSYR